MVFFYIRHGDPIYNPDSLTPLGMRQAEAVAKRLALYGVDKIYSSTSNRAIQTSEPTCELLKKERVLLDFCKETHAWKEFTVDRDGEGIWLFHDADTRLKFASKEMRDLGNKWYEYPGMSKYKKGIDRVYNDVDKFFAALGYEHIRNTGKYRVINSNDDRVALFAHQGFAMAFFSCLLDIPYPEFSIHFDTCHTGITVVDFKEANGFAIPRIMTLSSDSHLYKEGLPTNYNNEIRF